MFISSPKVELTGDVPSLIFNGRINWCCPITYNSTCVFGCQILPQIQDFKYGIFRFSNLRFDKFVINFHVDFGVMVDITLNSRHTSMF